MRRRIVAIVAVTTSLVVVAVLAPLLLLVRSVTETRALDHGRQEAQSVAVIVAGSPDDARLAETLDLYVSQGARIGVLTPSGATFGNATDHLRDNPLVARSAREQEAVTERHRDDVDIVVPVTTETGTYVVLRPVADSELRDGVAAASALIVALGVALVLGAYAAAHRLGTRVSTPVTSMADVAHRMRAGELNARVTPSGPPETVALGTAFNLLADRIHDLLIAEREAVADLGHRLRTPITALRLDAEALDDPALQERLTGHVDLLHRTVDRVVHDARRRVRESLPQTSDVVAVVRDRVEFWRPLAEDQERTLRVALPPGEAWVELGEGDLVEIVDTLLDNVFTHTPEGVGLRLAVARRRDEVTIQVEDAGPGLPADTPIARGHSGAGSTGLGLDIVRRLARAGSGQVATGSGPLGGALVTVTMPTVERDLT